MKKLLFWIARKNTMGKLVGFFFVYLSPLIPSKIFCDKDCISFFHPVPSYNPHILIVPRKVIGSILMMHDESTYLSAIAASKKIACRVDFKGQDMLLCVNAGIRQDVKQAHFHLIPMAEINALDPSNNTISDTLRISDNLQISLHKHAGKRQIEIKHKSDKESIETLVQGITPILNELDRSYGLSETGFTLKMKLLSKSNEFDPRVILDFK